LEIIGPDQVSKKEPYIVFLVQRILYAHYTTTSFL